MTYAWELNRDLTSVVLPLCRGPVNVSTGNRVADLSRMGAKFLSIVTVIRDRKSGCASFYDKFFDSQSLSSYIVGRMDLCVANNLIGNLKKLMVFEQWSETGHFTLP